MAGDFTVLHSFRGGTDGANPFGGLILNGGGDLYGTTYDGGLLGFGTVFTVSPDGLERIVYAFGGTPDGAYSQSTLLKEAHGALIGTTQFGGDDSCNQGCGTVFKLSKRGREKAVYQLHNETGTNPVSGVVTDLAGSLYGISEEGGPDFSGTVFKVSSTGNIKVLHSFTGGADGAFPTGALLHDTSGQIYGSTFEGGDANFCEGNGCGVIFRVSASGKFRVIYTFKGGLDGAHPTTTLIEGKDGTLFGGTVAGGSYTCGFNYTGCGTVFKIDPRRKESVVYVFQGGTDGIEPYGTLARDKTGALFGTTRYGGSMNCANGCGTAFQISQDGHEEVLHTFRGKSDGSLPQSGLVRDDQGHLYGAAGDDGKYGYGTVFRLTP